MSLPIIDISPWHFRFPRALGPLSTADEPIADLEFEDVLSLLEFLAVPDKLERRSRVEDQIHHRLNQSPTAREWRAASRPLGCYKHFRKYRGTGHIEYHRAARAVADGSASERQEALVRGLQGEIDGSKITAPTGQVVFHGRSSKYSTESDRSSFLSTSLAPTVAANHSNKGNAAGNRGVVYALRISTPFPALWGQRGQSREHELLFGRGLTIKVRREIKVPEGAFDIALGTVAKM